MAEYVLVIRTANSSKFVVTDAALILKPDNFVFYHHKANLYLT